MKYNHYKVFAAIFLFFGTFALVPPAVWAETLKPIYRGLKSAAPVAEPASRAARPFAGDYVALGDGEEIGERFYRFSMAPQEEDLRCYRPIDSARLEGDENLSRVISSQNPLRLCFALPPVRLADTAAGEAAAISFLTGNLRVEWESPPQNVTVEVSFDGENFAAIAGELEENTLTLPVAGSPTPVTQIGIRLFPSEKSQTITWRAICFDANLDNGEFAGTGRTTFAETAENLTTGGDFHVVPLFFTSGGVFGYEVRNTGTEPLRWNAEKRVSDWVGGRKTSFSPDKWQVAFYGSPATIPADATVRVAIRYAPPETDESIGFLAEFDQTWRFDVEFKPYFRQDYTTLIANLSDRSDASNPTTYSWCEGDRKVPQTPQIIRYKSPETIRIFAPKNDFESFQVVVRPSKQWSALAAEATALSGPEGATLSTENIQLRYGYYHHVTRPTDVTCVAGMYVDALVPLEQGADGWGAPLGIEANQNQPVFVTVKIPDDALPGVYHGAIRLGDAQQPDTWVTIPYELEVWDFSQPKVNRVQTAFGLGGEMFKYQNCKTEEEQRIVYEKYLQAFSDHRISPYGPTRVDWTARWDTSVSPPTVTFDFTEFDHEMDRVLEQYHFNTFRLGDLGAASSTFTIRDGDKTLQFEEGTPEYDAVMTAYLGGFEQHLEEKGWLDKAFCYWFDEPNEYDYPRVADGFRRLKKYAPKIRRMLTEQPSDEFTRILEERNADINIWCPVSNMFSADEAEKRFEVGEDFWWYVCTGPTAPYCTEFTDHPAHELRVWLWQSYQRKITGVLIWATLYWTCDTAFPDSDQNPYEDPMCYVSGYGTPVGMKRYWGNGDGRFLYPPLAAALPGANEGRPFLGGPVCSLRWEMLREGVEDYEMLTTLAELYAKHSDALPTDARAKIEKLFDLRRISTSATEFTESSGVIYRHRAHLAEAILQLQQLEKSMELPTVLTQKEKVR